MKKQEKSIEEKVKKPSLKCSSEKNKFLSEQAEQDPTDAERKDGWAKYGVII